LGVVDALELEDFRAVGLARLVRAPCLAALVRLAAFAEPSRLAPELARCDPLALAPLRPGRADDARRLLEAFLVVARSAMTLLGVFDSAERGARLIIGTHRPGGVI